MTYDNFRLSQALFASYMVTNEKIHKEIALKTLDFLTKCNFDFKKNYFDFIGSNGRYKKGEKETHFDQQPLEAESAVSCYLFAYEATKNVKYLGKAHLAFEWFFGKRLGYLI